MIAVTMDIIMGVFCLMLAIPVVAMIAYILWVVWWLTLQ